MANEEQLRILKEEGVEAWNKWREANLDVEIRLKGASLKYADLSGVILKGADLKYAYLKGAYLKYADLSGACLKGADLSGVVLFGANLQGVILQGADLKGADLSGANLQDVILQGLDLQDVIFEDTKFQGADLSGANLQGAYLKGADLSGANLQDVIFEDAKFQGANLSGADLNGANLQGLDLQDVIFSSADLQGVDLSGANLQGVIFSGANLQGVILQGLDLQDVILSGAILQGLDLQGLDLNGKDLSQTNLTNTNLARLQALGTDFKSATLTGACVEDWNINSETNFENVICDYIYFKEDKQERRPADPNRNFEPGEFAKLVEKYIETVDLIFTDGIDWRAFLTSFQDLRVEYGELNVSIQAIEKKSDGAFVIRLIVPPEADKAEVENKAKQSYETNLKVLEAKYRAELQAKDREITLYKERSADMKEIATLLASRPIVEAKEVTNRKIYAQEYKETHLHDKSRSIETRDSSTYYENYSQPQQTLAEAAAEIQKLLKQLEQTNPANTTTQQMVVAAEAIKRIEGDPTWKQRVINAAREGGLAAFEKALDNPVGAFITSAIKGWLET